MATNRTSHWTSTPFVKHQISQEAEHRVRLFLRECMPHLEDRPFSFARICWCADTLDRNFLISKHPDYSSLVLGCGGSGHGFCHIPSVGGFIADCLENKMDPQMENAFRWRPETAVNRKWEDKEGRFGPEESNHVMNFSDLKAVQWTEIGPHVL